MPNTMAKHALYMLALLQTIGISQGNACEGDSIDSCNGLLNTCTSEGLCVIDTSTGKCCSLSNAEGNDCVSSESAEVCEGEVGVADVGDASQIESAAALSSPTPSPTARPTPPPTKTPTLSPTLRPTTRSPTTSPTKVPTNLPTVSSAPTETCYNIEIGLIFDRYPDETKWEITKGRRNSIERSNAIVLKQSPYYDIKQGYSEATEKHIVCLPEGKYTYTMMDQNGDGMCCLNGEGRYVVTYHETGEIITQGSEFEQFESTTFHIPFVAPQLSDSDGDGVEDRTKNVIPPMILTSSGLPPVKCNNEFGLHLQTDAWGVETTWELRERSTTGRYEDGQVIASGGPYTSDFTYDISYCLYPGKYTFVFYDWQCDGLTGEKLDSYYALKINGEEVHRGGTVMDDYWEEVKLEFTKEVESVVSEVGAKEWSNVESVVNEAGAEEWSSPPMSSSKMRNISLMVLFAIVTVAVMLA